MPLRPKSLLLLPLLPAMTALAQTTPMHVSWQQHTQRLAALEQLVHDCEADTRACSADRVGADEIVRLNRNLGENIDSRIRYDWLRKALPRMAQSKSAQGKPDERMSQATAILERLASEGSPAEAPRDARKQADAVLRQVEFADAKPTLWQRFTNWLELWLAKHLAFAGVDASTASWLRIVLEIVLFTIPVLALGVWLMRQIREDRLIPETFGKERQAVAASVSWVKEAQACAERGEWREAIHALYWQTITAFEEKRIWAVTRNRTPREYLTLLKAGTEQRRMLREQTLLLESIWYGGREATESDYRHAAALVEKLVQA